MGAESLVNSAADVLFALPMGRKAIWSAYFPRADLAKHSI
jgi:hypothetical protein